MNTEQTSKTIFTYNKHTASGYSLFTHCSFNTAKNKHNYDRGKDCMKKCFEELTEHATKIKKLWKKEMIPLRNEENQSYHKQNIYYICKKNYY